MLGALRQSIRVVNGVPHGVHAAGGWGQVKLRATSRLTFNAYGGQESDRAADLLRNDATRNRGLAANVVYRWGSNVLTSFEASRMRTDYFQSVSRAFPHYDLAIAYLF